MALKLSDLDPHEVEYVGDKDTRLGNAPPPSGLKLSSLDPKDIEPMEAPVDPTTSPVTAATTGIIQGAIPFAGAIAGAGKAAMDAVTGVAGPLAPGGSLDDLAQDYRQARDSFSSDANQASKANPGIALASNVAGGLANPLFKGADTLPKVLGASALHSLGMSDADLTKGEYKQAAQDAALGAGAGAVGYGVGKAIPKAIGLGKYIGKKALGILGPSEEAINARLAGKAQAGSKNYAELADDMAGTLDDLSQQVNSSDKKAWNTLSKEPEIPKAYVTHPIEDALSKMKIQGQTIGGADKQASRVLSSLKDDLEGLGPNLSESDLKGIIQKLDRNINYDDQSAQTTNEVLKGIRHQFDEALKFRNSTYRKAMEPVSERIQVLDALKKKFGFKGNSYEGFHPDDRTASAIKNSLNENRDVTQKLLKGDDEKGIQGLKQFTGKDYLDAADDYRLSQQFENTGANGARRTVLGGVLGSVGGGMLIPGIGHTAGAAMGAGAGAMADRYGGNAAAKMIDTYVKAGNSKVFGKFAPVIKQAADKGPGALAVVSSILSKNPEFRQLMNLGPEETVNRKLGSQ
jgi:hypothetical protein